MPDRTELTLALLENYCTLIDGYRALVRQYGEIALSSGLFTAAGMPSPAAPLRSRVAQPASDLHSNGTAAIDPSRSYPPEFAARVLGVRPSSIRAYVNQGKLEGTRDDNGQMHIPGDAILKRQRAKQVRIQQTISQHPAGDVHGESIEGTASLSRVAKEAERDAAAEET